MSGMHRPVCLLALLLTCASLNAADSSYDLIIRNGTIYDGSGKKPFAGDVAIKGDKITKHLSSPPESWNEITVRHLLSHTSGIKDFINEPTVDMRKDIQPEDVIESLRNLPLNFPPGEKYAYSNTGYHLLAMIIRKITGQYWGEFLQERILSFKNSPQYFPVTSRMIMASK